MKHGYKRAIAMLLATVMTGLDRRGGGLLLRRRLGSAPAARVTARLPLR